MEHVFGRMRSEKPLRKEHTSITKWQQKNRKRARPEREKEVVLDSPPHSLASPPVMAVAVPMMVPKMSMPSIPTGMHGSTVIAVHSRCIVVLVDVHRARGGCRLVVVVVLDNAPFNQGRLFNNRGRPALPVHWSIKICGTCWLSQEQSQGKRKNR